MSDIKLKSLVENNWRDLPPQEHILEMVPKLIRQSGAVENRQSVEDAIKMVYPYSTMRQSSLSDYNKVVQRVADEYFVRQYVRSKSGQSESLVTEMPVTHHGNIGDFSKGSSFTKKSDRALVTHPVAVQKIKDFFKNTSTDFDFYFVNTKHARHYTEMGQVDPNFIFDKLKIEPDQLKDGKLNGDAITVFFTNNKGDEKVALTPWIIAHRLGHVLRREYYWGHLREWMDGKLKQILECYGINEVKFQPYSFGRYGSGNGDAARKYSLTKRHLCETLGTFKSARDKNLREAGEFGYELFAQYLKTGSVIFNPPPDILLIGYGSYGRKEYARLKKREDAMDIWREFQNDYPYYAEDVLGSVIGKVFVM